MDVLKKLFEQHFRPPAGRVQLVEGVGDRATVLAAAHSVMVQKGDAFFLRGFQKFVPGRDKTVALARVVAGRL